MASVDDLHNRIAIGIGAETLLRILSPLIEARRDQICTQLSLAPPDLPGLLDLRAQLKELERLRSELKKLSARKQEADEALKNMFAPTN